MANAAAASKQLWLLEGGNNVYNCIIKGLRGFGLYADASNVGGAVTTSEVVTFVG